jgi:hypothetical protein
MKAITTFAIGWLAAGGGVWLLVFGARILWAWAHGATP